LQIECEIVTVHRYPPPRDIWFDSLDFKHFDISLHLSILAESAWPLTSIVILHSLTSGNMYDMQFCLSCLGFIRKNDWFDFFFFFKDTNHSCMYDVIICIDAIGNRINQKVNRAQFIL